MAQVAFRAGPVADAVPPGRGVLGRQVDRVDPGAVAFQVRPEQPDQIPGELGQRDIIHGGLAFPQVVYEHAADRAALHLVAVDQFLGGALPGGLQERPAGDRRVRPAPLGHRAYKAAIASQASPGIQPRPVTKRRSRQASVVTRSPS